ncbi:MAG: hypothetical protein MUO82_07865 [Candidatus Thermoplasmatota archaeon]|nr:hypothetical protein [Candidatus Thermoplasmatota archaeon]
MNLIGEYIESRIRHKILNSNNINSITKNLEITTNIEKYYFSKFKKILKNATQNSRFYAELYSKINLKPNQIQSFLDITKIPFTYADDLKKPECFFTVSKHNFYKKFSSSGTSGNPKEIYFTKNDIVKKIISDACGLKLLYGLTQKDIVRIMYETGYNSYDWGAKFFA